MTRKYEPSEENRRTGRAMAGFGVPHADIATFIGVDAEKPQVGFWVWGMIRFMALSVLRR